MDGSVGRWMAGKRREVGEWADGRIDGYLLIYLVGG